MGLRNAFLRRWQRFWLRLAGPDRAGRWACRIGAIGTGPYYKRHALARKHPCGYFDYRAQIDHPLLETDDHVFIDQDVLVFQDRGGGAVRLGRRSGLHRGTVVQTGRGGSVTIGAMTSIQAHCHLAAYVGDIRIGNKVQIAPNCSFFSYDHKIDGNAPIFEQPLHSKSGIEISDDVWLGTGSIILDGARIGTGAVIAAGALVKGDIPSGAIAAGVPARVIRQRDGFPSAVRSLAAH